MQLPEPTEAIIAPNGAVIYLRLTLAEREAIGKAAWAAKKSINRWCLDVLLEAAREGEAA